MWSILLYVALLNATLFRDGQGAQAPANEEVIHVRDNRYYDGKALSVPMNTDGGISMYQRWVEQAFSGLFSAIAMKKIKTLPDAAQKELAECSRRSYDVIQHANCLKNILTPLKQHEPKENTKDSNSRRLALFAVKRASSFVVDNSEPSDTVQLNDNPIPSTRLSKYGKTANVPAIPRHRDFVHLRRKRALDEAAKPTQRDSYTLKDGRPNSGLGPIGSVAKLLTATVLESKNKTYTDDWQVTINRIQNVVLKRKRLKKEREQRRLQKAGAVANLAPFRGLKEKEVDDWEDAMRNPKKLDNFLTAAKRQRETSNHGDTASRISDLVREGVRVGFALAGENITDFDRKTLKLASPRFLSVVPEDVDDDNSTLNLLSPSLFSMHDRGRDLEKAASIGSLSRGFSAADRSAWLNLVMEATGVGEQADRLEKEEDEKQNEEQSVTVPPLTPELIQKTRETLEKDSRGEDGQPLYFTKENVTERFGDVERRKIEVFEQLARSYSPEQFAEMNTTGYSLLTPDQLRLVYGPESPYNCSKTLRRLLPFDNVTLHSAIERDVVRTAEMKSFQVRQKDIVLSPLVLTPLVGAWPALNQFVVLSPLVLSPIVLTPSVLGPAILSPFVFVPIILAPRVLAPLILTPLVFVPVVLSPLVFHPFILTPGVFVPFILTPFVLSPLILTPLVFAPLVLSPLVLSPLILNPMVGSPLVLSPFVLSPLILSPQALFALVLSPYALSPLVESKLIASALVLSPSWLS